MSNQDPIACKCNQKEFVQSSRFSGPDDRGREFITICLDCGKIHINGDRNGEFFSLSFHIVLPEHSAAIQKFVDLINETPPALKVSSYILEEWEHTIEVLLERVKQMDGPDRWAIREKGACLNKNGEWEIEPIPSSRDDEFFTRCRFDTMDEAVKFWVDGKYTSRYEHYKKMKE